MVLLKFKTSKIHSHQPSRSDVAEWLSERRSNMTRNQIEYLKLLETQRSNMENEGLTGRRDIANYYIGRQNAMETARANRARERQQYAVLGETTRSNMVKEEIDRAKQRETEISNRNTEALKARELSERERSNRRNELTDIGRLRIQLDTQREQARSNLANEEIKRGQVALGYSELEEAHRANTLKNEQFYSQLSETARSHRADEIERKRSNEENERIKDSYNTTMAVETQRSNKAREEQAYLNSQIQAYTNAGQLVSNLPRMFRGVSIGGSYYGR